MSRSRVDEYKDRQLQVMKYISRAEAAEARVAQLEKALREIASFGISIIATDDAITGAMRVTSPDAVYVARSALAAGGEET